MKRSSLPSIAFLVTIGLAVAACNKKGPDSEQLKAATSPGNKAAGEPYDVTVTPAEGKVEEPVAATVKVVPKGEYKVNLEYPHKLKVAGPEAATPREITLTKKQAKLSKAELRFQPSFKLSSAGSHSFKGTLRFSVCTEKQCEIKAEKIQWITKIASP
jgi:hypothetical protein